MKFKVLYKNDDFSLIEENELNNLLKITTNGYYKVLQDKPNNNSYKSIFLNKGDIFLIENREIKTYKIDSTIDVEYDSGSILYISLIDGYLGYKDNKLKILSPYYTETNNIKEYFIYLPANTNLNSIKRILNEKDISIPDLKNSYKFLIREGIPPIAPINAVIKWNFDNMHRPPLLKNGKIDYRSFCNYIEVKKGEVIAEKTVMVPGTPGENIYGDIIRVPEGEDIEIILGDNVYIKKVAGKEFYIAKETGILEKDSNYISLNTVLKINSDIGYETGNINYSGDVEIFGNINSLFSVNCGGNLSIKGSVENGGIIRCAKSVTIRRGIIGFETKIDIKGDLITEFIQDCKIRVHGDITVLNSIYNSEVFSSGFITVQGQRLHGKEHGSIVGGIIGSMKGMELHSVGSIASRTKLVCGIDLDLIKEMTKLKETLPLFNMRIIKLQRTLGLDLTHYTEDLSHLSKVEKEILKKKLLEIKLFIKKKEEISNIIIEMKERVRLKDYSLLKIIISDFILEGTKITIGDYHRDIRESEYNLSYFLKNNQIKSIPIN